MTSNIVNPNNSDDTATTNLNSDSFMRSKTNMLIENESNSHIDAGPRDGYLDDRPTTNSNEMIDRKKGVYKLYTDWLISNVAWSNDNTYKLAITSYIERYTNFIQLVNFKEDQMIESICTFEHPYPATKILWSPLKSTASSDLLATTADYLRLWRLEQAACSTNPLTNGRSQSVRLECLLNDNHGPLTSFDWTDDANSIVTSSFDATCSVWDVNVGKTTSSIDIGGMKQNNRLGDVSQQSHIYDVAWSHRGLGREEVLFCQDKSIARLDLRQPSTTNILFEMKDMVGCREVALVRLACNRQEDHLIASITDNSGHLIIIDSRRSDQPLCVLDHLESVNSISWSPKSSRGICSGGDDNQALIWQVSEPSLDQPNEPLLTYRADGKINAVSWAPSNIYIAIGYRNSLEFLRV